MKGQMVGKAEGAGRRRRLAGLAAALSIAVTPVVLAQPTADELARKHFESGVAYLAESDYPGALRAFEKSFELSKRPEILLNIATVHERAGNLPAAVASLERYLELSPNGEHVEPVKLRIANLKKRIEESPTSPAQTEPEPEPVPTTTGAPTAPPPTHTPPPPPPPSEPDRVPAYVAFGVGGLAAIGAIVTGVLAQSEHSNAEDTCAPRCTDDQLSSGKTLALTSTILTGVAIAGASVGAILWFTADSGEQPPSAAKARRFDVRVGGGPSGGAAEAVWRF